MKHRIVPVDTKKYDLIDGVKRNAEHPETFSIPDEEVRNNAPVGKLFKIGLEYLQGGGERFWVAIIEQLDDGSYVGKVDNKLTMFLEHGHETLIYFEPRHILSTYD